MYLVFVQRYQVSTELNILKPGEHSANGEGQGSVRIL